VTAGGDSGQVLVVRRFIPVPKERVFAAWLDAGSLAQWMRPSQMTGAEVEVDPRVGGKFRIVMIQRQERHEHTGEYLAIEPPSLLSFTWISKATDHTPTVVTIEFHKRGTGTELVLTHRRLAPKAVEAHREGWTDIMRLLDEALTRG
jgi:uncharacterized protein YndB with AHSA1/START domain